MAQPSQSQTLDYTLVTPAYKVLSNPKLKLIYDSKLLVHNTKLDNDRLQKILPSLKKIVPTVKDLECKTNNGEKSILMNIDMMKISYDHYVGQLLEAMKTQGIIHHYFSKRPCITLYSCNIDKFIQYIETKCVQINQAAEKNKASLPFFKQYLTQNQILNTSVELRGLRTDKLLIAPKNDQDTAKIKLLLLEMKKRQIIDGFNYTDTGEPYFLIHNCSMQKVERFLNYKEHKRENRPIQLNKTIEALKNGRDLSFRTKLNEENAIPTVSSFKEKTWLFPFVQRPKTLKDIDKQLANFHKSKDQLERYAIVLQISALAEQALRDTDINKRRKQGIQELYEDTQILIENYKNILGIDHNKLKGIYGDKLVHRFN